MCSSPSPHSLISSPTHTRPSVLTLNPSCPRTCHRLPWAGNWHSHNPARNAPLPFPASRVHLAFEAQFTVPSAPEPSLPGVSLLFMHPTVNYSNTCPPNGCQEITAASGRPFQLDLELLKLALVILVTTVSCVWFGSCWMEHPHHYQAALWSPPFFFHLGPSWSTPLVHASHLAPQVDSSWGNSFLLPSHSPLYSTLSVCRREVASYSQGLFNLFANVWWPLLHLSDSLSIIQQLLIASMC
jgi:hypothetical protein